MKNAKLKKFSMLCLEHNSRESRERERERERE